jgi:hypothetical protein
LSIVQMETQIQSSESVIISIVELGLAIIPFSFGSICRRLQCVASSLASVLVVDHSDEVVHEDPRTLPAAVDGSSRSQAAPVAYTLHLVEEHHALAYPVDVHWAVEAIELVEVENQLKNIPDLHDAADSREEVEHSDVLVVVGKDRLEELADMAQEVERWVAADRSPHATMLVDVDHWRVEEDVDRREVVHVDGDADSIPVGRSMEEPVRLAGWMAVGDSLTVGVGILDERLDDDSSLEPRLEAGMEQQRVLDEAHVKLEELEELIQLEAVEDARRWQDDEAVLAEDRARRPACEDREQPCLWTET